MVFHEENTYIRWMAYRIDEVFGNEMKRHGGIHEPAQKLLLFFLIRFADRFRLVSYDIMALADLTSRAVGYDDYLQRMWAL